MLAPVLTPQHALGVYQPIFGNGPIKIIKNTTIDVWEQCDLPKYDIWDDDVIQFIDPNVNPIYQCNRFSKPLTYLNNGSWGLAFPKRNHTCRVRCHTRQTERSNIIGEWIHSPGKVDCEILEAVCAENGVDNYGYLHTQVLPTPKREPKVPTDGFAQYDVSVILLDSLSYSQARRSLPRTISYMTDHMNAVLFPYINKVGDNSRPNGAALWFGKLLENLDRSLFEENSIPKEWSHNYMCNAFKDNETSLFSEFQSYGYKTLLAEDWAEGTLNWPNCKGFDKAPIDHNMRPFQNAMERKNHALRPTKLHLGAKYCREHHHTLLDYLGQFLKAYPDQNKFSWIWPSVLGHDTENGFPHSDNDFYSFMVKHRAQLDNSFVFFMGDHGLRFGGIRQTFVGALDVNNPFLAVSIPKKLRDTTQILEMMRENSQRIQTHFDTRATMLDILKYQSASNFTETVPLKIENEKGFSFIRRQPNKLRNCRNMPIPMQYCICQYSKTAVETNTENAKLIGEAITKEVNRELTDGKFTKECITMEFQKVVSLLQFDEKFKGSTLYSAEIEMKYPSFARFKANIKITQKEKIKILGMVERTNKYGNTASCIKSEHHRPFCYCRNQMKKKKKL